MGKQYSYNRGIAEFSKIDQLKLDFQRKEVEIKVLNNTKNKKGSVSSSSYKVSGII